MGVPDVLLSSDHSMVAQLSVSKLERDGYV